MIAENLVTNPGFEPGDDDRVETAPGWEKSPNLDFADYALDPEMRKGGGYAQRITSHYLDLGYVYQRVSVTGGRAYRASVWVKVAGDASAMVMAFQNDAEGRGIGVPRVESSQLPGDTDWTEVVLTVPTVEACARITLMYRVKTIGEAGGSAWFDEASLVDAGLAMEPDRVEVPAEAAEADRVMDDDHRPLLIPQPKQLTWRSDAFRLSPGTPLVADGGALGRCAYAVRELNEEIQSRFGFSLPVLSAEEFAARSGEPAEAVILGVVKAPATAASSGLVHAEGYDLEVTAQRILLLGESARGVFWGVQTLKSLVQAEGGGVWVRGAMIEDWPDHAFRGMHFFPGASSGTFHVDLIERVLAKYRFNHIVLESQYSNWESHPELHDPRAASKADLARIIEVAKAHHIEVTPLIQSLGHMDWMFKNGAHRDLVEDPDAPWAYNPLNPGSYEFLFDIVDEALALFAPRHFHIGHDEVRYEGRFPYSNEGRRLGFPELFIRDTLRLHRHLTDRGAQVMLWGDEIQRPDMIPHLSRLPKDLIIVDWNYSLFNRYPNVRELMDWGFPVICSTWYVPETITSFARAAHEHGAMGMLQTTWTAAYGGPETLVKEFQQYVAYVTAGDRFWNAGQDPALERYDAGSRFRADFTRA